MPPPAISPTAAGSPSAGGLPRHGVVVPGEATPATEDAGAAEAHTRSVPAWRRWLRRWGPPAFGLLVLGMLASRAHEIDWSGAWSALQRYAWPTLATVLGLALLSHVVVAGFDLIGRRHTRHALGWGHSWTIALTSYAFNLNLGSLVGGIALRARLYARAGLDEATVAQVVGVSMATNWLGYGVMAGVLFAAGAIAAPGRLPVSMDALRWLGVVMIVMAIGYIVVCAWAKGRTWRWRGRSLRLPSPRLATVQLAISMVNWSLMGTAMYLLLGQDVPWPTTLAVLMAAAIAGVVTPIPAGLGVIEAVYLALLSGVLPQGRLMGAVLAYRALYYLLPLGIALLVYAALERRASRLAAAGVTDADLGADVDGKVELDAPAGAAGGRGATGDAAGGLTATRGSPARSPGRPGTA